VAIFEIKDAEGSIYEIKSDVEPTPEQAQERIIALKNEENDLGVNDVEDDKPITGEEVKSLGESLVERLSEGSRRQPGITKKGVKGAITAAEVGVGFTPFSPISEFVGEFSKALIDNEDIETAIKAGTAAASVDLGIRAITGGVGGARSVKVIKAAIDKLPKAVGIRFGNAVIKANLERADMNKSVIKMAQARPDVLLRNKADIDSMAGIAKGAIKKQREKLGNLVGEAKKAAQKSGVTFNEQEIAQTKKILTANKEIAELEVKGGIIPVEDIAGRNAFSAIKKQTDKITSKVTYDDLYRVIKSIDVSPQFRNLYRLRADKGVGALTTGQRSALIARNEVKDLIDNSVSSQLVKNNIILSKKEFSDFAKLMDFPGFNHNLGSRSGIASLAQNMIRTGESETLARMNKLSQSVEKPFMDRLLNAAINKNISDLGKIFADPFPGQLFRSLFLETAKSAKKPGVLAKTAAVGLRRVGATIGAETAKDN